MQVLVKEKVCYCGDQVTDQVTAETKLLRRSSKPGVEQRLKNLMWPLVILKNIF